MAKPTESKGNPHWIVICAVLLALLIVAAGIGVYFTRYTRVDGELLRRDVVTLDLRDSGVTDVRGLARCRNLVTLDLRGNSVSPEDLKYLRARLPDCDILCDSSLGGKLYDSHTSALTLEDLPEDWENILLFPYLRSLSVSRCTAPSAMESLKESLPDCACQWNLSVGGEWFDVTSRELVITGTSVYHEELLAQLSWFRALKSVKLRDALIAPEEQRSLKAAYPRVAFQMPLALGDAVIPGSTSALIYSQTGLSSTDELEGMLDLLPSLGSVDFTGSPVPPEVRVAFRDRHAELNVNWSVPINGVLYPCDTDVLDFNGVALGSTEELEAAIPYFPSLKKIEMCDTGFSTEELDELNQRWPDVRIVWKIYFSTYSIRTDDTYFCAAATINGADLFDKDMWPFYYCPDMVALDLGHMYMSNLSFVYNMPNLTYLIIAESRVTDLTPLSSCKKLKYLEVFHTDIKDLSPLTECPELESLNLCYTSVPQRNAYPNLMKMEKLGRLWWCHCPLNTNQRSELQKAKPDLIMFLIEGGEPSGGTWRYDERYYEMRDALHMYYMDGGTNGVKDGAQLIVDDHGREFHLYEYPGRTYKDYYWWQMPQYLHLGMPYIIGMTDG